MPLWWPFALAAAFLLSVVATVVVRRVALHFGVVDHPGLPRKIHDRPIALMGGLAIFVAFAVPTIVILLTSSHFTSGEIQPRHFVGLFVAGLVLMVGGILDDRFDLPPRFSFAFPLLAAIIAALAGIGIAKVTNPFGAPLLLGAGASGVFTFAWLLATTYTTKLLDGLDGLAVTISGIASATIAGLAIMPQYYQPDVALLAALAAAAMAGFWFFNVHPARIFLGESGSTFLGFLVGVLAVISGGKVATALMVLGIPALDVAFVILRRLTRGKNPFTSADREHLHHLLLDRGIGQGKIVALYAGIAVVFGLTSLLLASWQKLVALAILFLLALGLVWRLGKKH